MGRKLKKGTKGNAAQYLTRTQAVKRLQLRLSEFRRLCILKGIHPREPKKKTKGANKTYYHTKDIAWLAHEPLIAALRARKAHERKVRKARAKKNAKLARRLLAAAPTLRLDHLVRERYPSFVDALRDLDDALTLVHLFASLPAEGRYGIPSDAVARCRALSLEWQAYVARARALRRAFISVKGFYYQAEVHGQSVTWLVPHGLAQVLPPDVDYRVMLTFLDFYVTLLRFVMFRLYHDLGLKYPPAGDPALAARAEELAAILADVSGVAAAGAADGGGGDAAAANGGGGGGGAAAPAAAPDIVRKLARVGADAAKAQGSSGSGSEDDDDASDADGDGDGIDSGDSELDSEAGGSGDEEEEEEEGSEEDEDEDDGSDEGEEEEASDEEDERPQPDTGKAAHGRSAAAAAAAKAANGAATAAAVAAAGPPSSVAGGALGVSPDDDAAVCGSLFRGCVVFLGREAPREPLLFIVRAFGGVAAWDGEGSPFLAGDPAITHHVVDRPSVADPRPGRAYVQPQWVVDCANARVLLPAALYAPGLKPPPHLSPFVDHEAEGYTPEYAETIAALQDAARRARERALGAAAGADGDDADADGADALAAAESGGAGAGRGAADAAALERAYRRELAREVAAGGGGGGGKGGDGGGSGSEEEDEDDGDTNGGGDDDEEEVDPEMAKALMTRKTRKFYERIQRAQEGHAGRVAALEARKAALDKAAGKAPAPAAKKVAAKRGAAAAAAAGEGKRVATIEPTMKKRRP